MTTCRCGREAELGINEDSVLIKDCERCQDEELEREENENQTMA